LDTIGGSLERWGREREPALIAALWLVVAVKVIAALTAPVLAGVGAERLPLWIRGRAPRLLGWIAAIILVLYGGVMTAVGLLVEAGVLDAAADADRRALWPGIPSSGTLGSCFGAWRSASACGPADRSRPADDDQTAPRVIVSAV
jgi:hypothetical protein